MNVLKAQKRALAATPPERSAKRPRASASSSSSLLPGIGGDALDFDEESSASGQGFVRSELSESERHSSEATREFMRIEALLRCRDLPDERRAELAQMQADLRANAPADAAAAAAVASVAAPSGDVHPAISLVMPSSGATRNDECAICGESFRLYHQTQLRDRMRSQANGGNQNDRGRRLATARSKAGVLNNGETVSDEYAKIFRFEELMRGYMRDCAIFAQMVTMQKQLVYLPMKRLGLPCAVWTVEMLATHYDVRKPHVYDKMRKCQSTLSVTSALKTLVGASCMQPDPDNPGRWMPNARHIASFERLAKEERAQIAMIERYHREKDNDLAAAMFALANAMNNTKTKAPSVVCDPVTAAGTGDSGNSMIRSTTTGPGTSTGIDFYKMSGY